RTNVVELQLGPGKPVSKTEPRASCGGQTGGPVVVDVAISEKIFLICLVGLQRSVFTHGFVQSVAGNAAYLVFDDQRLVEQRRDDVKHIVRRNVVEGADTRDVFQRESARKSAEAPQHGLLGSRQEVVAPVDCSSKRLMTWQANTISAGQKGKTVIQATAHLLDGQ